MSIAGSEGGGNSTATFGDSPEKAEEGNIAEVGEIMDADMPSPNPALTDATPSSRAAASSDSDGFVHVPQRAPIRGPAGMSPVPDHSPPASRSPYENTGAARRRATTPRTGTGPRAPRSLPPPCGNYSAQMRFHAGKTCLQSQERNMRVNISSKEELCFVFLGKCHIRFKCRFN